MTNRFGAHDLYVSTQGNDRWTGRLAEPNAAGTDGPFATLARARDAVRTLKDAGQLPGALTVWLRGGRYPIRQPVVFGPRDSAPVTYAAYPGETPVIDGGVPIAPAAWHTEPVNGKTAWVAQVPYTFRELFVNGQRRPRARLPKIPAGRDGRDAFYRMERVENVDFTKSGEQFIKLQGDPDHNQYVAFLRFEGLVFEHADWHELDVPVEPDTGMPVDRKYAASPQAASHVPGAIRMEGARYCAVENCAIRHVGFYGVELADGCVGNRIVGNAIEDLGAGGVKVDGADAHGPSARRSGNNTICDNHIHGGGRVYHSATGIFLKHSAGNTVSHNHIHDLYYSGISSGWVWGYTDSLSKDNRFEKNHIHDLGKAWLSDMGGIYTLSVQPGTMLCGNLIHDVEKANYGGWAIYLDEGSSHILVEDNVCYNTSSQPFNVHYGRENVVRNNVFALGREGQVALGRFILSDLNLFWDVDGRPVVMSGPRQSGRASPVPHLDLAQWQARGFDLHSVTANPCFSDLAHADFTLAPGSPALALGFRPINLSDVGPRPIGARD